MRKCWLLAALLALSGCGTSGSLRGDAGDQLVEASTTVLESQEHGPELCLGAIATSLPPQCGNVPVVGWDWDKVAGEERVSNTIWGRYHVVGTYDGTTFTLKETPGPPKPGKEGVKDNDFSTPCPKPPGGYEKPDPSKMSREDFDAAAQAAMKETDFSAVWIDAPLIGPPSEPYQDMANAVLNAAFTGDIDKHEADLRQLWGGAMCVTQSQHSSAELKAILFEVESNLTELGLQMLRGGAREREGFVALHVVFADAEDQAGLDARYGKGMVVLTSALKPVS